MFDEALYQIEMSRLLAEAVDALRRARPDLAVYTVSIWTDPNAAVSTVSFDSAENSAAKVAKADAWAAKHYARLLAQGDHEQAQLFAPKPGARNMNPADFALRSITQVEHRSFESGWETVSDGACWAVLEPALAKVRARACELYSTLPLHPEAMLAVNSARDWFDGPVELRPARAV